MGGTRGGVASWLMVSAMAAGAMPVSGIHGQEVDSLPEAELAEDPGTVEDWQSVDVLLGARIGLAGDASPGVDLQLKLNGSPSLSLQFLAHNTLGYIGSFGSIGREWRGEWYAGRIRMDLGRDGGIGFFAFGESGRGVRFFRDRDGSPSWDDPYRFKGIGGGARLTVDQVTANAELALGVHNEGDHGPYLAFGLGIQLRLLRLGL